MMQWLDPLFLIQTLGLIGVIAIVFAESGLFFGFFLPGDSLLFTAGLLASQDYFSIGWLLVGCSIAAIVGDSVGYWFGKKVGPRIFTKEDGIFFKKKHVEQTKRFYEKYGKKTIILARFVPIVRTFAPILAGVGEMKYRVFVSYNIIGGIVWVFLLSLLGFVLGNTVPHIDKYILPIVIFIIIVSLIPAVYHVWKEKREARNSQGGADES